MQVVMGCCSSQINEDPQGVEEYKAAQNYMRTDIKYSVPVSTPLKRGYVSHQSSSSSGVSSGSSTQSTPRIKIRRFTMTKNVERRTQIVPSPVTTTKEHELNESLKKHEDRSSDYYSEQQGSASSSSSSSSSNNLCYTQELNDNVRIRDMTPVGGQYLTSHSDFEMEMYMLTQTKGVLLKTSSPIMRQRDVTYTMEGKETPSHEYLMWADVLQHDAGKIILDVSKIPEALSGKFSSVYYPALPDINPHKYPAPKYAVDVHSTSTISGDEYHILCTDI